MTDNYPTEPPSGFGASSRDDLAGGTSGGTSAGSTGGSTGGAHEKMDTAKEQAADVKDTVKTEAGNVAGTAKDEAANVASEAKTQAKDLLRQTQQELKEQAATQQERVASGLHSVSAELNDMASTSENPGVASDVVRQVAQRADGAAAWLEGRDPGSLLTELKSFARRRPGVFIAGAAVAGVLAGRLTRALASEAKDDSTAAAAGSPDVAAAPSATSSAPAAAPAPVPASVASAPTPTGSPTPTSSETPLYAERVTSYGTDPVADEHDVDDLGIGLGGSRGGQGL
ncbi:hypothetical protein N1027_11350 [Herbiconiux sp. CPCC 205763]|uniref:Uncharacterized protein n=1 Tax=Herbiconiux aconitum TaxID=2970913 RepID=A0ABT2GRD1_9MICO|nr:hypothetical protein [Herbiconiux aconitum]MCS5718728.1 hypothetical protein [Herbiconiux aconitum]